MKTTYIRTVLLVAAICLQGVVLNAQNFQGIATYHAATKLNIDVSNMMGGDAIMTDEIKKQLSKQIKKEYTLRFNLTESTWQEVESLDSDGPSAASSGGGVVIRMNTGGAPNGILYKNTAEGKSQEEEAVFGKPFLVKGDLRTYEWQLTGETRKIGSYNAQQAIYERITTRRSMVMLGGDVDEETENIKEVQDTIKVTAWFTTDIPVSHGPEDYWGLPGLILEVSNGMTTLVCSKVVLNPEEGVELKMPSKGKAVTREEYQKIQEEKTAEMMKKYSGGGNATFRIGTGNGN